MATAAAGADAAEGYEFGLLGPLSGHHDGRELMLGSRLQRAVLAAARHVHEVSDRLRKG